MSHFHLVGDGWASRLKNVLGKMDLSFAISQGENMKNIQTTT